MMARQTARGPAPPHDLPPVLASEFAKDVGRHVRNGTVRASPTLLPSTSCQNGMAIARDTARTASANCTAASGFEHSSRRCGDERTRRRRQTRRHSTCKARAVRPGRETSGCLVRPSTADDNAIEDDFRLVRRGGEPARAQARAEAADAVQSSSRGRRSATPTPVPWRRNVSHLGGGRRRSGHSRRRSGIRHGKRPCVLTKRVPFPPFDR